MLATSGLFPAAISAGNEISVPPPATALTAPATNPAPATSSPSAKLTSRPPRRYPLVGPRPRRPRRLPTRPPGRSRSHRRRPPGRAGGRRRWLRERPGGRVGRRRGRRGRGPTSGYRRGGRLVSFADGLLVAGAGLVAGAVNAVAGGGSLAYRSELAGQRDRVRALGLVSVLGGITGAAILLATPSHTFDAVVPWLVLTAALLLFAQPRLAGVVAARRERRPLPP